VRILEQIGSYAGLAAIPGLAVLSALYFSQARDVRRLRDWAGRAPERAAEQAMGGRVTVQPGQAAQVGQAAQPAAAAQPPAVPGVKPAVATAAGATAATATAGAKPATATAAAPAAAGAAGSGEAATPAGRAAAALGDAEKTAGGDGAGKHDTTQPAAAGTNGTTEGAEAEEGAAAKPGATKPAALTPAAVASAAAGAAKSPVRPGTAGAAARTGPPAVGARPGSAGATTPRRQIPSLPSSSQTSVLGAGARPDEPWYRRLGARLPAGRYIALIVAGALVLGGGAAFAISQLAGGSDSKSGKPAATKSPSGGAQPSGKSPGKKSGGSATPAIDPSKFTVTVVNGTTIPNLARDTATKLSALGFQIGNKVTGTGSLAAAESVVEYKPGAEAAARFVAAKLHISQKQPADPDAIAQAGAASVIVVLGADQAPGG
jgi:hypothetical protein